MHKDKKGEKNYWEQIVARAQLIIAVVALFVSYRAFIVSDRSLDLARRTMEQDSIDGDAQSQQMKIQLEINKKLLKSAESQSQTAEQQFVFQKKAVDEQNVHGRPIFIPVEPLYVKHPGDRDSMLIQLVNLGTRSAKVIEINTYFVNNIEKYERANLVIKTTIIGGQVVGEGERLPFILLSNDSDISRKTSHWAIFVHYEDVAMGKEQVDTIPFKIFEFKNEYQIIFPDKVMKSRIIKRAKDYLLVSKFNEDWHRKHPELESSIYAYPIMPKH